MGDFVSGKYPELIEVMKYIRQNLHEPLTIEQLSRYVSYSPFHFIRIFKQQTGLTPQYYIASLRLQKAKELLMTTSLPVRDIAMELGYRSLGTFTTRFGRSVGMTPAGFRNSAAQAAEHLRRLADAGIWHSGREPASDDGVEGSFRTEVPFEGIVMVGLFGKPIPDGLPDYGTLVRADDGFRFSGVKPGIYYLMATTVSWGMQSRDLLLPDMTLRARSASPIVVRHGERTPHQELTLRPPRFDDPPILISLPLLMEMFYLQQTGRGSGLPGPR
jgi:AraC-type DNA-binding domain-containing proteins